MTIKSGEKKEKKNRLFLTTFFRYEQTIRIQYAPEIVTFDPVCDRDKIDIIEEHVSTPYIRFLIISHPLM